MHVDQPESNRAGQAPDSQSTNDRDSQSHAIENGDPAQTAVNQLLTAYGETLDSIGQKPMIVFLSRRSVSQSWPGRRLRLPRANFMAKILAEMQVATRVDELLRRGKRFRALGAEDDNQLDVDRLQDFKDSLSPVKQRTMAIWVILLTLVIAFPLAWITDYLRALAPQAIVCSSLSIRGLTERIKGVGPPALTGRCHVRAGTSLVEALLRVAHVNLNPGSVIDTALSVRANGFVSVLLLAVVLILSLCMVLLVFRSGFRLKRLAFSTRHWTPASSLLSSVAHSEGLYSMEREAFTTLRLRCPREFPLDLAVSAGILLLPLTIAADLLISAATPQLDLTTKETLIVFALGIIVAVLLRLLWLAQVWRSRIGSKVIIELQERRRPGESTLLLRSGSYAAVMLAVGYSFFVIIMSGWLTEQEESTGQMLLYVVLISIFVLPVLAWPPTALWWYRVHHELSPSSHYTDLSAFRFPTLSLIPSLAILALFSIFFLNPGFAAAAVGWLFVVGFIGYLVSIYRMGKRLKLLRCRAAPSKVWKTRVAGFRTLAMFFLSPVVVVFYFRHALNLIWSDIAEPRPSQFTSNSNVATMAPGYSPTPRNGLAAPMGGEGTAHGQRSEPPNPVETTQTASLSSVESIDYTAATVSDDSSRHRDDWPWLAGAVLAAATVMAAVVILTTVLPAIVGQLTLSQLRSGDCLTGSNLSLNTDSPWPAFFHEIPCGQEHLAEVFFASNYWTADQGFPGDQAINNQARAECTKEFTAYVGIQYSSSKYTYEYSDPDSVTWPSDDRFLMCIAYDATKTDPGGVPMAGSIKGSAE